MHAAAVKFGPCIQGGCFGFEHNEVFFLCAKPSLAVGGVESFAPCQNSPVHSVGGFGSFQVPNMLAKCCVICVLVFEG